MRLTQLAAAEGMLRVGVSIEDAGMVPTRVEAEAPFSMEPTDIERLRWYLEDFLEYPLDPAPELAHGVEQRMVDVGTALFRAVFDSNADARDLWATVRTGLTQARLEVVSDMTGAPGLPWELLRDPRTNVAVALRARTFVRAQHNPGQPMVLPAADQPSLRVLLVICRPGGAADVPFRSVASHLLSLARDNRHLLRLDVLRPPTFAALGRVLRAAAQAGRPYHVVHFDGHGAYLDPSQVDFAASGGTAGGRGLNPARYSMLSPARPGSHGYLLFEDRTAAANEQLVDGPKLGALLAETGVSVLVLNACRSAHAEAPTEPKPDDPATADVHSRVRAYGSLAQEVVDAGVPGVVAMRYNVWVVTAAQFVAELYTALLNGQSLGEAVSTGRKHLAEQPNRAIAFEPIPLQDWMVPVVYEAAPLALFARSTTTLSLAAEEAGVNERLVGIPDRPDVGFIGRDETLLALDRAFDSQQIVLLHAFAGSGKTSTAAEFSRWYADTGGLGGSDGETAGLVLFTPFEHHLPLPKVLDRLSEACQPLLEANGIEWLTLNDLQRRGIAMQVLTAVPMLWVWDNVEPVAGFPAGTASAWSPDEQRELLQFLRDLRSTKAKVLLTSRRDEHDWLGDLPVRVRLPPMPMRERVQMAAKIVERYPPHRITEVEDWRPLLRYTAGNPLTLTILVGQAVRQGLTSREQIDHFIARLRAGEADLDEDDKQGRDRSLAASLGYGLDESFSDTDRARLALLHLFHDHVDADALAAMGTIRDAESESQPAPGNPTLVPELAGLPRDQVIILLDRAAEIGLLTAIGSGYYRVHPALPWYFHRLFTHHYGVPTSPRALAAARAYTEALSGLGAFYHNVIVEGQRGFVRNLAAEEANLLHARALARSHHWWSHVMGAMHGLKELYEYAGRSVEWARLVDELTADLTDPVTDQPRSGLEYEWSIHTTYRVQLARQARNWKLVQRLHELVLAWDRQNAADALNQPSDQLDDSARNLIRNLAIDLHQLGQALREQNISTCISAYDEAMELARRIGDSQLEAVILFTIGTAYIVLAELRDLDHAEQAYQDSLILRSTDDVLSRAKCIGQLGRVAQYRYEEALQSGEPADVQLRHLNAALSHFRKALDMLPPDAVGLLFVAHGQIGSAYAEGSRFDSSLINTALFHYRLSTQYAIDAGSRYDAGGSRQSAALLLARHRDSAEALPWAKAALADFDAVGIGAKQNAEEVRRLIAALEAPDSDQQPRS
ncbi:MAG TPA: CHAT domain-containing protein [Jatrophihabitans sp.]|uniref:CHAT domain-containing protein n=1 Tax=Jatrophihabitans sp. TaxID=1932789 RepID=UPI002F15A2C9